MDFIYLLLPLEEEMESRLVKEITEELNQDKNMKTQEIKLDYLARMHELFYGESLEDRIGKIEAEKQKALAKKEAEKQKALAEKQKALAEKEASIQNFLRIGLLTDQQISEAMNVPLSKVQLLKKQMTE